MIEKKVYLHIQRMLSRLTAGIGDTRRKAAPYPQVYPRNFAFRDGTREGCREGSNANYIIQ